jgi:hypothetical protein
MAVRVVHALGLEGTALDPMRAWTKDRALALIPRQSFREMWRAQNGVR